MGVLDIDERIEVADKKAALYLRWKAEDDEVQSKHPTGQIYKWFAEHGKHWKPEQDPTVSMNFTQELMETGMYKTQNWTPLEVEYGQPHVVYGCGAPWYMITYICEKNKPMDLKNPPRFKPDPLTNPTVYTKMMQIGAIEIAGLNQLTGIVCDPTEKFQLRFPDVMSLHNVDEWPYWLINPANGQIRKLWENVTFWLSDDCNTNSIERLIYHPDVSVGDPVGYNFFMASDYFLNV